MKTESPPESTPIQRAVEVLGGQAAFRHAVLAVMRRIDPDAKPLNGGLVSQWVNGVRPVGANHCIAIETATAEAGEAVTRYALRRDVFGTAPDSVAAKAA